MIDLGIGPAPSTLAEVTLDLDEMQFLLEQLQIDELPVVLQALPRYDKADERDLRYGKAKERLEERGYYEHERVDPELAEWLRILALPHWIVALRLYADGNISRCCLAKGDEKAIVAMRGPESYLLNAAGEDLTAPIIAALGTAEPLEFGGLNAPTEPLVEVFGDTTDSAATERRLSLIGVPPREAGAVASAMVHCYAHAEIVGVVYGHGTRDQAPGHVAVFDTRDGRFIAKASEAGDGTRWSALSSGSDKRLKQALQDLIANLPEREEFPQD